MITHLCSVQVTPAPTPASAETTDPLTVVVTVLTVACGPSFPRLRQRSRCLAFGILPTPRAPAPPNPSPEDSCHLLQSGPLIVTCETRGYPAVLETISQPAESLLPGSYRRFGSNSQKVLCGFECFSRGHFFYFLSLVCSLLSGRICDYTQPSRTLSCPAVTQLRETEALWLDRVGARLSL